MKFCLKSQKKLSSIDKYKQQNIHRNMRKQKMEFNLEHKSEVYIHTILLHLLRQKVQIFLLYNSPY